MIFGVPETSVRLRGLDPRAEIRELPTSPMGDHDIYMANPYANRSPVPYSSDLGLLPSK